MRKLIPALATVGFVAIWSHASPEAQTGVLAPGGDGFAIDGQAAPGSQPVFSMFVDDAFVVAPPGAPADPTETIATADLSIPFGTCSCGVDGLTWSRGNLGTSDWVIHGVTDRGVRKLPDGYALFDARGKRYTRYVDRGDVLARKWSPLADDSPPFLRKGVDGIVDPQTGAVFRETVSDWFAPVTNDAGCSIAWDFATHLPAAVFDQEGNEVVRFRTTASGKTITGIDFPAEQDTPSVVLDYVHDAQGGVALSRVRVPGADDGGSLDYFVERGSDALKFSAPSQSPVELSFYPGTRILREKTVGDARTTFEVFREGSQWAVKILEPGGEPSLWSGTGAVPESCPLYDYMPTASGAILRSNDGSGPVLEVGVDLDGVRVFEIETAADGSQHRRDFDGRFNLPVRESAPEGSFAHSYDAMGRHVRTARESDGVVLTQNTWAGSAGSEYLAESLITDGAGYERRSTDDGDGSRSVFEKYADGDWRYTEIRALLGGGYEVVQASPEGVKRRTVAEDGGLLAESETSVEEAMPAIPALIALPLGTPVETSRATHCLAADGSVDFGCDGQ